MFNLQFRIFSTQNDEVREKCSKLDNWKICNGTTSDNTSYEWDYYLDPIIIKNKIVYCNYTCEVGENEKCKTCGEKENKCIECNYGYKLKDGKCIASYFYIKALYRINESNKNIKLINGVNIIEMKINDKIINPSNYYTFSSKRDYSLNILINYTTSFKGMFYEVKNLTSISFEPKLKNIEITNMNEMFFFCKSLESIDLSNLNTEKVTDMYRLFSVCNSLKFFDLSNFKTTNVKNIAELFYNCISLTSIDLSNFNTQNVENMGYMFNGCQNLTSLDLSKINTQNVQHMTDMLGSYNKLAFIDISSFKTNNVISMSYMFYNCKSLTSLDLSKFETQNVQYMDNMFCGCTNLNSIKFQILILIM